MAKLAAGASNAQPKGPRPDGLSVRWVVIIALTIGAFYLGASAAAEAGRAASGAAGVTLAAAVLGIAVKVIEDDRRGRHGDDG